MLKSGNIDMMDYNLGEKYADKFISVDNKPMYDFDEFSYFGKQYLWNPYQDNEYENLFDRLLSLSQWAKSVDRTYTKDTTDKSTDYSAELAEEPAEAPDKVKEEPKYEPSLLQSDNSKVTQIGKFNVAAAIDRLHYLTNFDITSNNPNNWTRKSPTSKARNCARAVRMAMEAGGLSTDGRPRYGGNYGPFLLSHGWKQLSSDVQPQAGDICVTHGLGKEGWGHISMFDGQKWISDYVQNSWKQFSKAKLGTNTHFYRYKG